MIKINPTLGVTNFKPGESISGRISWNLDDHIEEIIINLIWHTVGKGTEDVGKGNSQILPVQSKHGESDFNLIIPQEGPWSYSGHLISIVWILEVVTNPTSEKAELEIVVGPEGKEIICSLAEPIK